MAFSPWQLCSIILETDPIAIASRVSRPKPDAGVNLSEITINEQTLMNVSSVPHAPSRSCCARSKKRADILGCLSPLIVQAFSTVRDKMAQRILQG